MPDGVEAGNFESLPHITQFMKTTTKMLMVAVTAALFVIGCATTHSWEYRTRTTTVRIGKTTLDEYGKSGWELVEFVYIPTDRSATNFAYEYIFKRIKK